jgi:methionyl-tRNA synthetase
MTTDNFYITTPIYYVNDKPHIGHAYTTILADVLARYNRLLETPTFFLTGTDEHGQKVEKAAVENDMTPIEQCDTTVVRFQELWERLNITNDYFIRTTQGSHKEIVKQVLQDLYNRDLIYKAEYKGHYCVPCERFFTEKDLVDGNCCPDCKRETDEIIEANYFFRMSNYQEWLIDYIKTNPDFIQPAYRANETLGFLKQPLGDLCISRPKSRLSWGIELPFDSDYVCYVWFDALINYISGIGYGSDDEKFKQWWPASYHLIGKDILTTHTVYWPTMLKAMGLEQPKSIFAHGWWLIGNSKMSKSSGNVVNPMDMCEKYGVDAFRYFLLSEMVLGQDASFTEEQFILRYNSDLANDLGNFLNRVVKMTIKQFDGTVPAAGDLTQAEHDFIESVLKAVDALENSITGMKLDKGLNEVIAAVRAGNRYMEITAPWALAKSGDTERLKTVMATSVEALRIISGLLLPVMPNKMAELRRTLGINGDLESNVDISSLKTWANSLAGAKLNDIVSLFPRIQVEEKKQLQQEAKQQKKGKKKKEKQSSTEEVGVVTFDEFFKSQLKTAKVLEAERVPNTDKLMKLQLEVGDSNRQIVAGIAQFYKPEDIIGKTIIIVANLKPAKICGVKSEGMLLAAKSCDKLQLVTVDGDIESGSSVG